MYCVWQIVQKAVRAFGSAINKLNPCSTKRHNTNEKQDTPDGDAHKRSITDDFAEGYRMTASAGPPLRWS